MEAQVVWDTAVKGIPDFRWAVRSLLAELELSTEAEQGGNTSGHCFDPFRPPSPFD